MQRSIGRFYRLVGQSSQYCVSISISTGTSFRSAQGSAARVVPRESASLPCPSALDDWT